MPNEFGSNEVADFLRELARQGILAKHLQTVFEEERRRLRIAAYSLVWPVVFQRLTRRLELRRGHHRCASSVYRLEPECLDRFHDDVDAALDDLFRNANKPIFNLEGWVSTRLSASTINAYRRRRGERGALQRPRLPGWLATGLNHEPRLMKLALEMLEWVGVLATAGPDVWPLAVWAERRAMISGDYDGAYRAVVADVETVLTAMRRRQKWYADFVERPLGRKPAPLAQRVPPDSMSQPAYFVQADQHESEDARQVELAAAAIAAIDARLMCGEDLRTVVVEVIGTVFGPGTGAEDLGWYPGQESNVDEQVAALLADPAAIDHLVKAVLDLIRDARN